MEKVEFLIMFRQYFKQYLVNEEWKYFMFIKEKKGIRYMMVFNEVFRVMFGEYFLDFFVCSLIGSHFYRKCQ